MSPEVGGKVDNVQNLFSLSAMWATGIELKWVDLAIAPFLLNCPTGLCVFSEEFFETPKLAQWKEAEIRRGMVASADHVFQIAVGISGISWDREETLKASFWQVGKWQSSGFSPLKVSGGVNLRVTFQPETLHPAQLVTDCVSWFTESLQTSGKLSNRVLKSVAVVRLRSLESSWIYPDPVSAWLHTGLQLVLNLP